MVSGGNLGTGGLDGAVVEVALVALRGGFVGGPADGENHVLVFADEAPDERVGAGGSTDAHLAGKDGDQVVAGVDLPVGFAGEAVVAVGPLAGEGVVAGEVFQLHGGGIAEIPGGVGVRGEDPGAGAVTGGGDDARDFSGEGVDPYFPVLVRQKPGDVHLINPGVGGAIDGEAVIKGVLAKEFSGEIDSPCGFEGADSGRYGGDSRGARRAEWVKIGVCLLENTMGIIAQAGGLSEHRDPLVVAAHMQNIAIVKRYVPQVPEGVPGAEMKDFRMLNEQVVNVSGGEVPSGASEGESAK